MPMTESILVPGAQEEGASAGAEAPSLAISTTAAQVFLDTHFLGMSAPAPQPLPEACGPMFIPFTGLFKKCSRGVLASQLLCATCFSACSGSMRRQCCHASRCAVHGKPASVSPVEV